MREKRRRGAPSWAWGRTIATTKKTLKKGGEAGPSISEERKFRPEHRGGKKFPTLSALDGCCFRKKHLKQVSPRGEKPCSRGHPRRKIASKKLSPEKLSEGKEP